jgi:hypothetical protein
MAVAKVGTVAHGGGRVSSGSFSGFLHFSLHLEALATLATMTLHAS